MDFKELRWIEGPLAEDQVSEVSFVLPYPDWCKVLASDEWALLEEFVDSLEKRRRRTVHQATLD